ncbi:MAG: M48 family metallopeptidase [Candidatus Magasanikbacteria bacterium]|nr:M48 family metallopeptidase [Candidatus Magasanikbacteria bacterium]
MLQKKDWILKKVAYFKRVGERVHLPRGKKSYHEHKHRARQFVHQKISELNAHYNFSFNRVAIKNHSTRWGSCSKQKNLNFNYRILFLSNELADYVIVHELCHLREMNHSKKFWALVAHVVPDFKERWKQLRLMRM